jgi:hypothetical protein
MIDSASRIDGVQIVYPPWSSDSEAEAAVRALATASKRTAQAAYSRVLLAFGNEHASTYWPAVLAVIPALGEILRGGADVPISRTLHVLIDIVFSSRPEPGFELVVTPDGPRDLAYLAGRASARLTADVERIAADAAASAKTRRIAAELLGFLAERPHRPRGPAYP